MPEIFTQVKKFFGVLDTLDADTISEFFAPGAIVRLPGAAPIAGREAIRKALIQFSIAVDDLRHQPVQHWMAGNLSVFEADMTMTLADRTALSFPVTHVTCWVSGMIQEARVNVYLESRMELALSAFDRICQSTTAATRSRGSSSPVGHAPDPDRRRVPEFAALRY